MFPLRRTLIFLRVFSILTLLLLLPALLVEHSLFSFLVLAFGLAVVLVAFGFAFGQSVERRALGKPWKRRLDELVVWALVAVSAALAWDDRNSAERRLWFAIAVMTLCLESFYRISATRLLNADPQRQPPSTEDD